MNRNSQLKQIQDTPKWDVLVIGGGACGLGAALDAASRGYRTLLLEQDDFAQGTSSRSTKLIHGGVRYLPQGRFLFVRSALQERARLIQNAPHLVHPLPFILPCSNRFELCYYTAGIKLYDLLAGKRGLGASRLFSKNEMETYLPQNASVDFRGGICYFDAQFDDARLAINLAQSIVNLGSCALNYMKVQKFIKAKGKLCGVIARDTLLGTDYEINAKVIVNATGGYVDSVRAMDEPNVENSIVFSQGAHLVLNRSFFPSQHALIIPQSSDGRIIFIIPWYHRILIGTTDTPIKTNSPEPKPLKEEIDYLLQHTNKYLCKTPALSDICSTFAGVRSLVRPKQSWKNLSKLEREHSIIVSPSNLISLAGGKWTTYRQMGEETIDVAAKIGQLPLQQSSTAQMQIHGSSSYAFGEWQYYGSDAPLVDKLATNPTDLEKLHPDLPCRPVDILWAIRQEMAFNLEDVMSRRGRSLLFGAKESMSIAPKVVAIMAKELVKDDIWIKGQIEKFNRLAMGYLPN